MSYVTRWSVALLLLVVLLAQPAQAAQMNLIWTSETGTLSPI